jgi:hypothetical protein
MMKMRHRRISNALILSPEYLGLDHGAGFLLIGLYPYNHSKGTRWRPAQPPRHIPKANKD